MTLGVQKLWGSEVSKFTLWADKDDHRAVSSGEGSSILLGVLTHAFICPEMRDETGCATYLLGSQKNRRKKKVLSLSTHQDTQRWPAGS